MFNQRFHAALTAWHRRGDWSTRDALWRAACWVGSARTRATQVACIADLKRAERIVASDTAATAAFNEATGIAGAIATDPRAIRPLIGSWERF